LIFLKESSKMSYGEIRIQTAEDRKSYAVLQDKIARREDGRM